jgi:8-oxo-dGTP diphosphatase
MIKCQFENGNKACLRHITIGAIILNKTRDEILLVKRAPNLSNPNKYALPGGFLERDEDTATAALREALEETGYKIKIIAPFRINDNPNRPKEDRQNVDFIYLTEATERVKLPDKEISEVKWFKLNNLPREDEFAFDHLENIKLYLTYLKQPFSLPLIK